MEDYKEHLVIIFAGYKGEMKEFVETLVGNMTTEIGNILSTGVGTGA